MLGVAPETGDVVVRPRRSARERRLGTPDVACKFSRLRSLTGVWKSRTRRQARHPRTCRVPREGRWLRDRSDDSSTVRRFLFLVVCLYIVPSLSLFPSLFSRFLLEKQQLVVPLLVVLPLLRHERVHDLLHRFSQLVRTAGSRGRYCSRLRSRSRRYTAKDDSLEITRLPRVLVVCLSPLAYCTIAPGVSRYYVCTCMKALRN